MNESPISLKFCLFQATSSSPSLFFLIKMTPLWNIFALIWRDFFTHSLNLHLHIWQYLFFFLVSQTLNTALGKRGEKKKLTLLLPWIVWNLFLKECVRLGRSLGFPFAWQSQVNDSSMGLRDIRWGWLYLMWDTEDTTAFHPTHSFQVCMALSLAKQFWCSCLQVLKYLLSTTLLRSYLCLSWCWKIPVKFKKH